MSYTVYTQQKVFNDNTINVAINALYDFIDKRDQFDLNDFGLSGNPAIMVQDEKNILPVRVIPFITANLEIFTLIRVNLKTIWPGSQMVAFEDCLQVVYNQRFYEFWLHIADEDFSIINFNGISVQLASTISDNLK